MRESITAVVWMEFKDGTLKRLGRKKIFLVSDPLIDGILKDGRPVKYDASKNIWKIPYLEDYTTRMKRLRGIEEIFLG
ncbi:MAG: hypothetical protein QW228_05925 [Candidatus Aenigmatarchaeota archaeon]